MKIAGKRRMEPEWSSQTGAARMEHNQNGAGLTLELGHHFVWIGSSDGTDAVTIISLIYMFR